MASAGKGLPFIGKMNEFLDRVLHPTVQKVGNSRAAIEVIHKGYYVLNPAPSVPYVVEAGSTDNLLVLTGHTFKDGDMIRLLNTANNIKEFEIIIDRVVDANTVALAGYLSASLTAGDTFDALRAVSERFAADGSTLASLATPPVSYNRKVAGVTTQTLVLDDQDDVTNNRSLPVNIRSIDGAPINITAGDLNVSLDHANDSTKIGDGTRLVGVTANNELRTHDTDALTVLNTIDSDTSALRAAITTEGGAQPANVLVVGGHNGSGVARHLRVDTNGRLQVDVNSSALPSGASTETKQDTIITALANLLTELQAKADLLETQPVSIAGTVAVSGPLTDAQLRNTAVPVSVSNFPATQPVSAASLPLPTGASTEAKQDTQITRLESIRDRLPPAIGEQNISSSLSIVQALGAFFTVRQRPLTNVYAELLTLSAVDTFVAPTDAIGAKIMLLDVAGTTGNLRFKMGGVASATSGMQMQAGRSEDLQGGSNISVCPESGTCAVAVIWTVQA
jgi:hypothetical protein